MTTEPDVICFGEVLWDSVPDGLFLGGAPLNVAAHVVKLGRSSAIVSCVGKDSLGAEARARITRLGVDTSLLSTDNELPTGFVDVELSAGVARYDIRRPAAWDRIRCSSEIAEACSKAKAFVFGSLSQRSEINARTLAEAVMLCPVRVFDVNLRPPHYDAGTLRRSLAWASHAKMNDEELAVLSDMFSLRGTEKERARDLAALFDVSWICVTRAAEGAALLAGSDWLEVTAPRIEVADTIGAGDAFLAAVVCGMLEERAPAEVLRRATRVGSLVASRRGAIPDYSPIEVLT